MRLKKARTGQGLTYLEHPIAQGTGLDTLRCCFVCTHMSFTQCMSPPSFFVLQLYGAAMRTADARRRGPAPSRRLGAC